MTSHSAKLPAILLVAALLPLTAVPVRADYEKRFPKEMDNVGIDEHLDEVIPLDTKFRNHNGQVVRLRDYFRDGKPVILSLNYSNCPMLCNQQLTGLTNGLKEVEWTAGKDYEIVSVSIDPREPVDRANETREKYLNLYGRNRSGWHFLVGSHQSIDAITQAIGFRYNYLPDVNQYVHPAAAVLLTPDGRISRYMYGVEYKPQMLRLSLVEASEGKIGSPGDQIILFCFHYDPQSGTYAPNAARMVMAVGGLLTVVVMGGWLFILWSKDPRRGGRSTTSTADSTTTTHQVTAG